MIKIPEIGERLNRKLRRGQIKLAHWPNGSLCHAAKNMVSEVRYFDLGKHGFETKIVQRFAKSKSYRY